ncbi:MAG: hypothetical protein A3K75_00355 [Euryarchaeota archaeon RBG_13_61_15]|nr:MAG: hypothetical protein A3K75_00355 [Euryarchaeota archaeon RBG_13_61_15]
MQVIGLLTENPRAYYEMIEALREKNIKFVSLDHSEHIPAHVGVIITTEAESEKVGFDKVVTDPDPDSAVAKALAALVGDSGIKDLVIGIDPGTRPGFAVVGDGRVLKTSVAPSPEAVGTLVEEVVREHPDANVVIRIGHGDRTNRNRVFNKLWDEGHKLEIVDERNTTKRSQTPDEDAAVEIAITPGYKPRKKQDTDPCEGEIRNIQRLSRLESSGRVTVSRDLARKVAKGELSMTDAVDIQSSGSNHD